MEAIILLEIHVAPENVAGLEDVVREMLPETRRHDGCISIMPIRNQADPGNVVLMQRWKTRAHYEKYLKWRADTGVSSAMTARISAKYDIRYFDPVEA